MSELVVVDGFSMLPQGPTLSLGLAPGQWLCVVGPSGSGKTRFLRTIQGRERTGQGRVALLDRWSEASRDGFGRRATPQSLARKFAERRAADASQALTAAGLWEKRTDYVEGLSETQAIAAEFLWPLAGPEPIVFLDGSLDRLDRWTLQSVIAGLRAKLDHGACVVAATNRISLCAEFDLTVVLNDNRVVFAGSHDELLREGEESELIIESATQPGVTALVEPFEVSLRRTSEGLAMRAAEGQAIAAKLLMEGYGNVKLVVQKAATVEEAIDRIVGRAT